MSYTPPDYPSTIPSQTGTAPDLPDRVDDVDWLYAARYNELKKELIAVMTELGTLPKGTFSDVTDRLDYLTPIFHDRGDPAAYDFTQATLTADDTWRDLDLSGIAPAGAKAVSIFIYYNAGSAGNDMAFRKNGNSNAIAKQGVRNQVANVTVFGNLVVACDTDRVIEYNLAALNLVSCGIIITGWWL